MQQISLKSIKWESIKSVFRSVSAAKTISRADISAQTGLSLMTVGKVADALLDLNIIHQTKERRAAAGRRAGVLCINPEYFALILDLTSRDFRLSVVNIKLDVVENRLFSFNDDFTFEENLTLFLKDARKFLTSATNADNCIGLGISLPGAYSIDKDRVLGERLPALSSIPIYETVRRTFADIPICIDASYNAAATSKISEIDNYRDKIILYFLAEEDDVSGAIVEYGEILKGRHNAAGNFGEMMIAHGRTLQSSLKQSNPPHENASLLARAIYNAITVIDPDEVILECELYKNQDAFAELVYKHLRELSPVSSDTLPRFTSSNSGDRHSHRGLTMKLTEVWLSHLVFDDTKK